MCRWLMRGGREPGGVQKPRVTSEASCAREDWYQRSERVASGVGAPARTGHDRHAYGQVADVDALLPPRWGILETAGPRNHVPGTCCAYAPRDRSEGTGDAHSGAGGYA